ncbi:MAG: mechanosensitive ion channel [Pseudomonadota bacterium]|nr:mechanosensitive ion channel [Pseudomonadota bacterium]
MEEELNQALDLTNKNLEVVWGYLIEAGDAIIKWIPDLLFAVLVLVVGLWVAKRLRNLVQRGLEKRNADPTLTSFLDSFLSATFKAIVIIMAATMLGIKTASIIAALGAAGLAVGLALQGSLSNLAGGVLILFFKPFKVGDIIEAQGVNGTVERIQIFNTIVRTFTNEEVFIPNGSLANDVIKNYSSTPTRRIDLKFGIGYDDDMSQAKAAVKQVIDRCEYILNEPEPVIAISGHADSYVEIDVRIWVKNGDMLKTRFYMFEEVKKAFDEQNISIPFPQQDLYIKEMKSPN